MNEKPAAPPFIQYHAPPRATPPDPVARGIKLGITTAVLLGVGYALLFPLWLQLSGNGITTTLPEMRDIGAGLGNVMALYTWYGVTWGFVVLVVWALGGMGGAIGGAMIGYLVREWLLFRTTRRDRVGWGIAIGLLLTLPLWIVGELLLGGSTSNLRSLPFLYMAWYFPLLLTCGGFCSVAYRLLEQEHA